MVKPIVRRWFGRAAHGWPQAWHGCACVGLCLTVLMAGCQSKGTRRSVYVHEPSQVGQADRGPVWVLQPARVRVFPLTRFVQVQGQTMLDAKIELLDEMGDSVKGVGDFRLELYAKNRSDESTVEQQLYSWDISMRTLEDQKRCFDSITRTYRFRLKLDETQTAQHGASLRAAFITYPKRRRLQAQADLVTGP